MLSIPHLIAVFRQKLPKTVSGQSKRETLMRDAPLALTA